jgi:hypothetical protein
MSRAYRIQVRESLRRILRAHDRASTQLELLEVLPAEQMAQLLTEELQGRGFEEKGGALVRQRNGVTVTLDPKSGTLTIETQAEERTVLKGKKEGSAYDDVGPQAKAVRNQLKELLQRDLEKQAGEKTAELQSKVTEKLEQQLGELRLELDGAVNRVTAEALKQKARQMGRIKEMSEDPQTGSLTIVVEV